jgi:hypothetical protein
MHSHAVLYFCEQAPVLGLLLLLELAAAALVPDSW